jgi:hypothetical protein
MSSTNEIQEKIASRREQRSLKKLNKANKVHYKPRKPVFRLEDHYSGEKLQYYQMIWSRVEANDRQQALLKDKFPEKPEPAIEDEHNSHEPHRSGKMIKNNGRGRTDEWCDDHKYEKMCNDMRLMRKARKYHPERIDRYGKLIFTSNTKKKRSLKNFHKEDNISNFIAGFDD